MGSHIGDAGYEVIKDGQYSYYGITNSNTEAWIKVSNDSATGNEYGTGYYNSDYALIGHCALPFVGRGGTWNNGAYSGVFAWLPDNGREHSYPTFRPVLVV